MHAMADGCLFTQNDGRDQGGNVFADYLLIAGKRSPTECLPKDRDVSKTTG
ncbi:hypothetical protein PSFL111601_25950 [Pseudomonas floridensis]